MMGCEREVIMWWLLEGRGLVIGGVGVNIPVMLVGWLTGSLSRLSGSRWGSWELGSSRQGSRFKILSNHMEVSIGVAHFWNSVKYFPTTLQN